MTWDPLSLPNQRGKVFVVTGGNAGIGYFVSEQLASTGGKVVIACRDERKGSLAVRAILNRYPTADVDVLPLDLADLSSVADAAAELRRFHRIDALVCNAGVVGSYHRRTTADGFELQMGTNHLGHFALIGQLFPTPLQTPPTRIVHLGSIIHRYAKLDLEDLMLEHRYSSRLAYGASKLAVMMFGFELDRRLRSSPFTVESLAAHPGLSLNTLTPERPPVISKHHVGVLDAAWRRPVAQGKDAGAWPVVRAALDPSATGGQYWGPDGFKGLKGLPVLETPVARALDPVAAAKLWNLSEELTGVRIRF